MDWITITVEAVGLIILLTWVVVPIREFRSIFKRLKQEQAPLADRVADRAEVTGGFEVIPDKPKEPH